MTDLARLLSFDRKDDEEVAGDGGDEDAVASLAEIDGGSASASAGDAGSVPSQKATTPSDDDYIPASLASFLADAHQRLGEATASILESPPVAVAGGTANLFSPESDISGQVPTPTTEEARLRAGLDPLNEKSHEDNDVVGGGAGTESTGVSTGDRRTDANRNDDDRNGSGGGAADGLGATQSTEKNRPDDDFFSPCSDVNGPFDNAMGSCVKTNPSMKYRTTAEAMAEAMSDDGSCPGSCDDGKKHDHGKEGKTAAGMADLGVEMDAERRSAPLADESMEDADAAPLPSPPKPPPVAERRLTPPRGSLRVDTDPSPTANPPPTETKKLPPRVTTPALDDDVVAAAEKEVDASVDDELFFPNKESALVDVKGGGGAAASSGSVTSERATSAGRAVAKKKKRSPVAATQGASGNISGGASSSTVRRRKQPTLSSAATAPKRSAPGSGAASASARRKAATERARASRAAAVTKTTTAGRKPRPPSTSGTARGLAATPRARPATSAAPTRKRAATALPSPPPKYAGASADRAVVRARERVREQMRARKKKAAERAAGRKKVSPPPAPPASTVRGGGRRAAAPAVKTGPPCGGAMSPTSASLARQGRPSAKKSKKSASPKEEAAAVEEGATNDEKAAAEPPEDAAVAADANESDAAPHDSDSVVKRKEGPDLPSSPPSTKKQKKKPPPANKSVAKQLQAHQERMRRAMQARQGRIPSTPRSRLAAASPRSAKPPPTPEHRSPTVPHAPKLATQALRGDRVYSATGKHQTRPTRNPITAACGVPTHGIREADAVSPSPDAHRSTSSPRKLTVPRGPELTTRRKYGEKPCPTERGLRYDSFGDHLAAAQRNDAAAGRSPASKQQEQRREFRPTKPVPFKLSESKHPRPAATPKNDGAADKSPASKPERHYKFRGPTKPVPFKLSEGKHHGREFDNGGDDGVLAKLTLAEQTEVFLRKGLRESMPSSKPTSEFKPTCPKPPRLSTPSTSKRPLPKSALELEEEMMKEFESHPFRAQPVHRHVLSTHTGGDGIPKVPKKTLTTPSPFKLRTEERHVDDPPPPPTTEELKAMECRKQFHAKPMPDLTYRPPAPPKPETQPRHLTTPKPFRFSSEGRPPHTPRAAPTPDELELSKKFHALPMPRSTYRSPSVKGRRSAGGSAGGGSSIATPSSSTQARSPRLSTSARSESRRAASEASHSKAEALKRERARSAARRKREAHLESMGRGVSTPVRSGPTVPAPFALRSDARGEAYRSGFEEQVQKEEEEARRLSEGFRARPVPRPRPPSTGRKPRAAAERPPLTEPSPFRLKSDARHEAARKELAAKIEEEERERRRLAEESVRATPVPKTTYEPRTVSVAKSTKKLVEPVAPKFVTEEQEKRRREFEAEVRRRREEEDAARIAREAKKKAEEEEELREMRRLPVSEGGLIPKAEPIGAVFTKYRRNSGSQHSGSVASGSLGSLVADLAAVNLR